MLSRRRPSQFRRDCRPSRPDTTAAERGWSELQRVPMRLTGSSGDRSVGRSHATAPEAFRALTEAAGATLPAPQGRPSWPDNRSRSNRCHRHWPGRLHEQFIHRCELHRPRRRHVLEAAAERIVVADRRPVDPHRRVDRSLPRPAAALPLAIITSNAYHDQVAAVGCSARRNRSTSSAALESQVSSVCRTG